MNYVRPVVTVVAWTSLILGVLQIGSAIATAINGYTDAVLFAMYGVALIAVGTVSFVVLKKDPTRATGTKPARASADGVAQTHVLTFAVGDLERHTVTFTFDQVWGWMTVTVDGEVIIKKLVTLSFRLVTALEFTVGHNEVHAVRIEKHRTLLASFARPQPIKGFVDVVLVAENDGLRSPA